MSDAELESIRQQLQALAQPMDAFPKGGNTAGLDSFLDSEDQDDGEDQSGVEEGGDAEVDEGGQPEEYEEEEGIGEDSDEAYEAEGGEEESEEESEEEDVEESGATAEATEECPECAKEGIDASALAPAQPEEGPFLKWLRNNFGNEIAEDLRNKYQGNEAEIVKGLVEAWRKVGARDDQAWLAKQLEQIYGQQGLQALLTGLQPQASHVPTSSATAQAPPQVGQNAQPQADALKPPVAYDPDWPRKVAFDPEKGKYVPTAIGTDEDVKNYEKFLVWRERVVNQFASDPVGFIKQYVTAELPRFKQELIQEYTKQLYNLAQQQQVINGLATFYQSNARLLFVQGNPEAGLTKLGQAFERYKQELYQKAPGIAHDPISWNNLALELAKKDFVIKEPRPQPPARQERRVRQSKPITVEDLIKRGYSLSEAYAALERATQE